MVLRLWGLFKEEKKTQNVKFFTKEALFDHVSKRALQRRIWTYYLSKPLSSIS